MSMYVKSLHLRLRHLEFKLHIVRVRPHHASLQYPIWRWPWAAAGNCECRMLRDFHFSWAVQGQALCQTPDSTRFQQFLQHMLPQIPARSVGIHNLRHWVPALAANKLLKAFTKCQASAVLYRLTCWKLQLKKHKLKKKNTIAPLI